jgi:hypothetical protein
MERTAMKVALVLFVTISCVATGLSADFDGDGVADDFAVVRDSAKEARVKGIRVVNPLEIQSPAKQAPKGLGLRIRLSRASQTYLVHDREFFSSPMWVEAKPAVKVVTRKDSQYKEWKKQVPDLKGDAVELGTEAGIEILLYWTGKEWSVYWPQEEP